MDHFSHVFVVKIVLLSWVQIPSAPSTLYSQFLYSTCPCVDKKDENKQYESRYLLKNNTELITTSS